MGKVIYKSLAFTGDIHGDIYLLALYCPENTNLIVCGDIGLGWASTLDQMEEADAMVTSKNSTLYLFRGNHDNPDMFIHPSGPYKNIKICKDFTTLRLNGYSILLWGGARSVDKTHRTPNKSWWEGERVLPLPKIRRKVDIVCTHTAPSYCAPANHYGLVSWAQWDPTVVEECHQERALLDQGYEYLASKPYNTLEYWFYGHFHEHNEGVKDKTKFVGLDMLREKPDIFTVKIIK